MSEHHAKWALGIQAATKLSPEDVRSREDFFERNDMPSTHAPCLLQQALKPQLKSRFQKVVMDNKRGSRNKNGIISHHGFSAFVSANGQQEQFQPHRKVQLLLTILLEWEQRQMSPL